ncbi:UDP-N-acetylmuramoyl-tripeptide--D-alanyl-D-alanine ligase [Sphingosinicella microcystinivorans]|nr:UDP-N-acetylmuramoyl-tripeptide--D-alanyl-D-alanine ligase [Sphingosinicella microcystinivorans]RKS88069.1 UDP-N-acetylmuramoyl-tripeptide--D-alanyl-D-alanine ligase [Sphingosinicella microcystinivorans]
MSLWTAAEIAGATGGTSSGEFVAEGVTFDSREIIGGELFIAMKGEATDGHRFIEGAHEKGAAGFLVSEDCAYPNVRVPDSFEALQALGRAGRDRVGATIVGVTGSVGKTSVKEALRHAFQEIEPEHTHWSVKSYNNHTGVPLSLARMPRDARLAVFEMGMNHTGELAALTRLVRPQVAVVTWVTSAHLAFFENEEAIADAKGEIFEGLEPGGVAVLPFDSPHYARLRAKAERHAARIFSFGSGAGADVRALQSASDAGGSTVIADVDGNRVAYRIPLPGAHWIANSLAVLAAVHAAGVDLAAAALGLSQMQGLEGRGAQYRIPAKDGEALLIDESYNANPASMAASLAVLGAAKAARRIAVLGPMRELGDASERLHAELAPHVSAAKVDVAVLVGDETIPLESALPREIAVVRVSDAAGARAALSDIIAAGDAILLKASNSVGLGRIASALRGIN